MSEALGIVMGAAGVVCCLTCFIMCHRPRNASDAQTALLLAAATRYDKQSHESLQYCLGQRGPCEFVSD